MSERSRGGDQQQAARGGFDPRSSWSSLGTVRRSDNSRSTSQHGSASSSSVGSHDEESQSQGYRLPQEAAHMLTGETRFPSTMSYMSEGQRSDMATVDSASAIDDAEVESMLSVSREDSHEAFRIFGAPAGAGEPDSSLAGAHHTMASPQSSHGIGVSGTAEGVNRPGDVCATGESRPINGQEEQKPSPGPVIDGAVPSVSCSLASDANSCLKDAESKDRNCSSSGEEDDEVDSLDVEAPSVGTRSVQSREDAAPLDLSKLSRSPPLRACDSVLAAAAASSLRVTDDHINPLLHSETSNGGRRSPGGTIYEGRERRGYQGHHMHLSLRRFHEGAFQMLDFAQDATAPLEQAGETRIPGYDPRVPLGDLSHRRRDRLSPAEQREPRSRSRSPTDHSASQKLQP